MTARCIKAGPASGFGNWVVIQHSNGDVSIYGHMKYFFVHAGQKVKAGEKIAVVGDQGFSTGPHLHFEVHQGGLDGTKINPIPVAQGPRHRDRPAEQGRLSPRCPHTRRASLPNRALGSVSSRQ